MALDDKINICFVCLGNTCRSPMAEHIAKALDDGRFEFYSRGLAVPDDEPDIVTPEAVVVMKEAYPGNGMKYHIPKQIDEQDIIRADLILTMDKTAKDILLDRFGPVDGKVRTLREYAYNDSENPNIMDPLGGCVDISYAEVDGKLEPIVKSVRPRELRLMTYRKCRDDIRDCVSAIVRNDCSSMYLKAREKLKGYARAIVRKIDETVKE